MEVWLLARKEMEYKNNTETNTIIAVRMSSATENG